MIVCPIHVSILGLCSLLKFVEIPMWKIAISEGEIILVQQQWWIPDISPNLELRIFADEIQFFVVKSY